MLALPLDVPVASIPLSGLLLSLLIALCCLHRPAWRGNYDRYNQSGPGSPAPRLQSAANRPNSKFEMMNTIAIF